MTSVTEAPQDPLPFSRPRSRRTFGGHFVGWLRQNLFFSIPSTIVSLLLIFVLAKGCASFAQWGVWNAVWTCPRQ